MLSNRVASAVGALEDMSDVCSISQTISFVHNIVDLTTFVNTKVSALLLKILNE